MNIREAIGEIGRLLLARPIQTVLVAGLAAAMVVAVLLTVGRAVVLEQLVEARTETPEARMILIVDTSGEWLIRPEIVDAVARIGGVERVVAMTTPVDAVNLDLGPRTNLIPVWGLTGDIRDVASLRSGRWAEPGEVLVSEAAKTEIGISGPFGALLLPDGQALPIVGTYGARPPFGQLAAGAVWQLPNDTTSLLTIQIVSASVRQIDAITVAALSLFNLASVGELRVERAAALAELQHLLAGDIDRFGRELVIAVLMAGMLLVGLVVLAEVLSRRKDFGRQRALGARRSTVILLLAGRTAAAAALGSIAGLTTGIAYLAASTGEVPRPSFSVGLIVLAILAPALASTAPASWAARRDPVLELRTP